jgi:hypothetical protein
MPKVHKNMFSIESCAVNELKLSKPTGSTIDLQWSTEKKKGLQCMTEQFYVSPVLSQITK